MSCHGGSTRSSLPQVSPESQERWVPEATQASPVHLDHRGRRASEDNEVIRATEDRWARAETAR